MQWKQNKLKILCHWHTGSVNTGKKYNGKI